MQGVLSPVVTPFDADYRPDAARFVRHCQWLLSQDVGLAVGEKIGLLDTLVEAGLPPSRMMPGTGACALGDTVELTKHAVKLGCGGVLMLPPFYYKGNSDEGLFRSYSE